MAASVPKTRKLFGPVLQAIDDNLTGNVHLVLGTRMLKADHLYDSKRGDKTFSLSLSEPG
jgi:hypothetical protein